MYLNNLVSNALSPRGDMPPPRMSYPPAVARSPWAACAILGEMSGYPTSVVNPEIVRVSVVNCFFVLFSKAPTTEVLSACGRTFALGGACSPDCAVSLSA